MYMELLDVINILPKLHFLLYKRPFIMYDVFPKLRIRIGHGDHGENNDEA